MNMCRLNIEQGMCPPATCMHTENVSIGGVTHSSYIGMEEALFASVDEQTISVNQLFLSACLEKCRAYR